jgi:hypothetical protein
MYDAEHRLRDRIFTRAVAQRMTHPIATLSAGLSTAVPIAAGLPIPVAVLAGLGGWAAAVLPAVMSRRSRAVTYDQLTEPWASFVREAQDAAARYRTALGTVPDGVIRDQLVTIGGRIEDGVVECSLIASRGTALDAAMGSLDSVEETQGRLEVLSSRTDETAEETRRSLRAQLRTTERLADTRQRVSEQLHLLDARLDEAVARAVELGLSADQFDVDSAGRLGSAIEAVVGDMESLRQALEESSELGLPRPTESPVRPRHVPQPNPTSAPDPERSTP